MDLNSPRISQHTDLSQGSIYKPGETFVGNAGFFSAETCNKIAYEDSESSSASTAGMQKTASNLAAFAKKSGQKASMLPAVCNSLGIKIDPIIVHMSISGGKIDQGGTLKGHSIM